MHRRLGRPRKIARNIGWLSNQGVDAPRSGGVETNAIEQISRNLRIVSLCTVASRVLGMVRDAVMAATFGAGPVLDAFALAFRIPNLARSILGEGAVATAFLPV